MFEVADHDHVSGACEVYSTGRFAGQTSIFLGPGARDGAEAYAWWLNGGTLDGARVLSPETVAELGLNQIGSLAVRKLETALPASSDDDEFFPGMPKCWSLAFMVNEEDAPGGGRSAGSLAWAGLGNTYYWIDPQRDLAGVVVTQILPFADPKALDLLNAFERAVTRRTDAWQRHCRAPAPVPFS